MILACTVLIAAASEAPGVWDAERAWQWYRAQPWLVGFNYVPSSACNTTEFWQRGSFDPDTIDRELEWASDVGFSTCRVFVQYLVWQDDPEGLKRRFDRFLSLAARHGISVMPVLFDDCSFGDPPQTEPVLGKQRDVVPGLLMPCWTPSPGLSAVVDPRRWAGLEGYVRDMVGSFGQDERLLMWDLYNEPGNSGLGNRSLPLVEAVFHWARQEMPWQPLTVGAWGAPEEITQRQLELSDVVSFHCYGPRLAVQGALERYKALGRPVICTEWMARLLGSRWDLDLPLFRAEQVGCYNWGLVNGRTQTHYPWSSKRGAPEPDVWFHDLFHRDGEPYDAAELWSIGLLTGRLQGAVQLPRVVVPAAEAGPVEWRSALQTPDDGWSGPGFDDSAWAISAAPFGSTEPEYGRRPNTAWDSPELWLRREFRLPERPSEGLALYVHHDDDAEVYLNGVLAARLPGYNAAYHTYSIRPEARRALRRGTNLMAVHCTQVAGGQYFDAGLVEAPDLVTLPPLKPLFDFPVRDTSICLGPDDTYYLTGTSGHPTWWQTNEGIRMWRSKDLEHWQPLGLVWTFERDATWQRPVKDGCRAIWAPEVHYLKGTFWLTYCVNWPGGGTGILRSTTGRAEGPYADVEPNGPLTPEIDASLFQDDGAVYFIYQNGKIARMRDDMSGLAEEPRFLGPAHALHVGFEGAALYKIDGRYHLIAAEFVGDPPQYHCMSASSDHLMGPYGDRYIAVPHGGHNVLFADRDGQWWSTFFGNDALAPFVERPAMLRIEFDDAGRIRPKR